MSVEIFTRHFNLKSQFYKLEANRKHALSLDFQDCSRGYAAHITCATRCKLESIVSVESRDTFVNTSDKLISLCHNIDKARFICSYLLSDVKKKTWFSKYVGVSNYVRRYTYT